MKTTNKSTMEEKFRILIKELDDKNTGLSISRPIKGDIYFDGIEVEQFIRQLLVAQKKKILEILEKQMVDENKSAEENNLPKVDVVKMWNKGLLKVKQKIEKEIKNGE